MENLKDLIKQRNLKTMGPSYDDMTELRIKTKRQEIFHCEICNDEEIIFTGDRLTRLCECVPIRNSLMNIYYSKAGEKFKNCTLENYIAVEDWQMNIKDKCREYLENSHQKWLYIGGQIGSGKSHLCTAVFIELLKSGNNCVMMNWKTDSNILKAIINDVSYGEKIDKFKKADVLYIDDFLKSNKAVAPTQADTQLAYEIIEHRYSKNLKTIISSEKYTSEVLELDEAVGSRIIELSSPYIFDIGRDTKRNYRLQKIKNNI